MDMDSVSRSVVERLNQAEPSRSAGYCQYEFEVLDAKHYTEGATIVKRVVLVDTSSRVVLSCGGRTIRSVEKNTTHTGQVDIENDVTNHVETLVPVAVGNAILKTYCNAMGCELDESEDGD